jgi:oxygen-independent coproporphyrinogen-3 oxidase
MPVAGLYVHVPFRRARRPYDDSAYVVRDTPAASRFGTALRDELQGHAVDESITTLYVGGGRASLLSLATAHSVLAALADSVGVAAVEEATAEVSPADATLQYLRGLRRLGIDRLSLGVLSFSPAVLRSLDAPYSATDARQALRRARKAGFEAVSVDLLFGLPTQSLGVWVDTLRRAIGRGLPHIAVMEGPPLDAPPSLADKRAEHLERAMTLLRSAGYEQYELTHFARPGHRSAHQENYYAHGNYLGIGPSAESFWWPARADSGRARRWHNVGDFDRYARLLRDRGSPVADRQTLDRPALAREYVLLRLRTGEGLGFHPLATQYGVDLRSQKGAVLDRLRREDLIHDDPDRVRLTPRGRLLTDAITKALLPE